MDDKTRARLKEEWIRKTIKGEFDKEEGDPDSFYEANVGNYWFDVLDREITKALEEQIIKIRETLNPMFPFREEYHLLPELQIMRMTGQGEVMMELNKLLDGLLITNKEEDK